MLCQTSRMELKMVAVGKERLSRMNAFQLKEHEERLDAVIARCKLREPEKFWDQQEIPIRAREWREGKIERRFMGKLRLIESNNTVG